MISVSFINWQSPKIKDAKQLLTGMTPVSKTYLTLNEKHFIFLQVLKLSILSIDNSVHKHSKETLKTYSTHLRHRQECFSAEDSVSHGREFYHHYGLSVLWASERCLQCYVSVYSSSRLHCFAYEAGLSQPRHRLSHRFRQFRPDCFLHHDSTQRGIRL